MKDLLDIVDLTPADLARVLDLATAWKRPGAQIPTPLSGQAVAMVFEKPSARTRVSTEQAVVSLGGHPVPVRDEEVGIDRRETAEDVARTLAAYCAVVAARVREHRVLERMAAVVPVPVVNLLSDRAHPCQALADLLTLREHLGHLEGRRLAFVGDGNNVAASLVQAAALSGLEIVVASPPGYELDDEVVERARNLGGSVELVGDPHEAVVGADAVYTDVWVSMGDEDETDLRRSAFRGWQVDARLMDTAGPGAIFMHCLPAHRGEEVSAEVLEGPRSVVWQQAANRLHSVRALLAVLLEGR